METPLTGGCFCGAIRYRITAPPFGQANCHCRACQRATGGAFAGVLLVPTEALEVAGEYREFTELGDSGNKVSRGFCPQCGSTLFARTTRIASMRPVYAATLDKPELFTPTLDAWVDFAQPWVTMDESLPKYRRDLPAECAGLPAPKNRRPRPVVGS
ncbi:MAG: GFA family protein [Gammaproteobacteria bacterium]|nr:GFA family protein [Gammaproteobacteria bacterium]MBQ0838209.1 GFA family protein [Gammaproteobacteria bacterium]